MIQGEDCHNLGHIGSCGGWDHGFGEGQGFSWGEPNAYGMRPVSHQAGWGFGEHEDIDNYGGIYGHKGGFGSGFAGWGNQNTGDMLHTDQEIGEGEFEPHHPLVVEQGRGHFSHNSHNHGIGYGFNKGYKSNVADLPSKEVLSNINAAIDTEVSNINEEAQKLKEKTEIKAIESSTLHSTSIKQKAANKKDGGLKATDSNKLEEVDADVVKMVDVGEKKTSDSNITIDNKTADPKNNLKEKQLSVLAKENHQHKSKTSDFHYDAVRKTVRTKAINEKPINVKRTLKGLAN